MIEAVVFDLDGTLVQTERLKALSYARAARELRPDLEEQAVIEAFRDVVGLPRREVACALLGRFGLEEAARARMEELHVLRPWQAFVRLRLRAYEALIRDPKVLKGSRLPEAIRLLGWTAERFPTALATMSHCEQALYVLETLGLRRHFDFIATRDDVECGKPDPEIYRLAAQELGVPSPHCLALEDSPAGVRAALGAGMRVVAVATPLTLKSLRAMELPERAVLVEGPAALEGTVKRILQGERERARGERQA